MKPPIKGIPVSYHIHKENSYKILKFYVIIFKMIVLIDGNSIIYRSYFAIRGLSKKDGFPTNAIFGFVKTINKIEKEFKPENISVAFDVAKKTFRNEIYKDYKGTRPPMPEDLLVQIPKIKEFLKYKGIPIWEFEMYEADDLIGTISKKLSKTDKVLIVTTDKDLFQLIDENIHIYYPKNEMVFKAKETEEKFGVPPDKIVDVLALMGDTSDNIPGVKGIGEKTALKLIKEFKSIENLYENLQKVKLDSIREKLEKDKENAFLSKKLLILKCDLPLEEVEKSLKKNEENKELLKEFYKELEFFSLLKEIENGYKIDAKVEGISLLFINGELNFYNGSEIKKISFEDLINIKEKIIIYQSKEIFKFLLNKGIKPNINFEDLEVGAYLLNPEIGNYPLDDLFSFYLNQKIPENIEERLKGMIFIWDKIEKKLKEENLMVVYSEIEKPLIEVLSSMENNGIFIDKNVLAELSKESEEKIKNLEEEIYKISNCKFNLNSPKQLREILYEKLKIPPPSTKTEKKKEYSTGEEALKELENLGYPIASLILKYREYFKLKSTYLDPLSQMTDENGRVHTTFKQTQTSTGRLASQNPNLQNIPIRSEFGGLIRKAFSASNKNVLVVADYSQIELRLMAHYCQDPALMKAFFEEKDIHSATASYLFKIKEEEVTPEMRRRAKTVNFGILYGMSAHGLAQNLGISREEAKEILDRYFQQFPKVKEFFQNLLEEARKSLKVSTIFGRKRTIPELKSSNFNVRSNAERMAINAPLQGSAADIIKLAMISIYPHLENSKMLLQVHDELLLETNEENAEGLKKFIKEKMESVVKLKVPLVANVGISKNWFGAK